MASDPAIRQSVSLPSGVAKRVRTLARKERTSASRIIVDLIEAGLAAREQEKKEFFELADRLADSSDVAEQERLKRELGRLTYGDYVSDSEMADIRSSPTVQKRLKRGHKEAAARRGRFV
jgi:hypothetical protein